MVLTGLNGKLTTPSSLMVHAAYIVSMRCVVGGWWLGGMGGCGNTGLLTRCPGWVRVSPLAEISLIMYVFNMPDFAQGNTALEQ